MLSVRPYCPHGLALSTEVTLTPECKSEYARPLAQDWTKKADEWMKTLPDSETGAECIRGG